MIGKGIRLLMILSIAGAVPYAWYQDGVPEYLNSKLAAVVPKWGTSRGTSRRPEESTFVASLASGAELDAVRTAEGNVKPSRSAATFLEEVIRFDVDDRWIIDRWPRVSTILAEPNRQGLRVPLVTGTQLTDLAGSLSYYFDKHRRVRRISFEGHTGDSSRLVEFATKQFGMREEPTLKAGLYLARWNAYPTSAVYVRHAPVVRESAPRSKMEVRFEINRPDAGYALSSEFLSLLNLEWLTRESPANPLGGAPIRETLLDRNAPQGGL